jgi:hypothetical protein
MENHDWEFKDEVEYYFKTLEERTTHMFASYIKSVYPEVTVKENEDGSYELEGPAETLLEIQEIINSLKVGKK